VRPTTTRTALIFVCALALAGAATNARAAAQTPGAGPPPSLVLLPYEEPGTTDPHAAAVTQALVRGFAQAGMPVKAVAPVDHLQALANARKVCADNGVRGILVAAGRYEQTPDQITVGRAPIGRRPDLSKPRAIEMAYPAHVELRLDELGCDGVVRWTTTTTADETLSPTERVRNVGKVIDEAFLHAAYDAAAARAAANVAEPAPAPALSARTAPPGPPSMYALLPYEQPGIADPHGMDITRSLFTRLQRKNLVVNTVKAMDHFEVIARAPGICAATGAQAIIVPALRIEQAKDTASSHASLRLSLLNCGGAVLRQASAEADVAHAYTWNLDAAIVDVSERAMDAALTKLFPAPPATAF
jgi:hypothetical protein